MRRLFVEKTHHCLYSIARYSVIQLSELEQGGVNEPAQGSTRCHRIHTWLFSGVRALYQPLRPTAREAHGWADTCRDVSLCSSLVPVICRGRSMRNVFNGTFDRIFFTLAPTTHNLVRDRLLWVCSSDKRVCLKHAFACNECVY